MQWALVFILSYNDPSIGQGIGSYAEHATVTPQTYFSQAECEAAGQTKLANLNWSSDDGSQLRWICTQDSASTTTSTF